MEINRKTVLLSNKIKKVYYKTRKCVLYRSNSYYTNLYGCSETYFPVGHRAKNLIKQSTLTKYMPVYSFKTVTSSI